MRNFFRDESAQSVVEYILVLATVLMIFWGMKKVIGNSMVNFWKMVISKIARGCPECEPPPELGS